MRELSRSEGVYETAQGGIDRVWKNTDLQQYTSFNFNVMDLSFRGLPGMMLPVPGGLEWREVWYADLDR